MNRRSFLSVIASAIIAQTVLGDESIEKGVEEAQPIRNDESFPSTKLNDFYDKEVLQAFDRSQMKLAQTMGTHHAEKIDRVTAKTLRFHYEQI